MRKDIVVVRESIGRVVSMLTSRRVRVTQRGSQAYVRYDDHGAINNVNIPYLPDDASEEFVAAIQGFLDHEIGHVLHSDFKALKAAKKCGARVANLANIIEDVYVERKMGETFRGSAANLDTLRRYFIDKMVAPKIREALAVGNKRAAEGYATVMAFRAWGGQPQCQDFVKQPEIAELVAPMAEKLGEELIERIGKCRNSFDCLDLAKDVKAKLEERKPKAPPAPPPPSSPPADADDDGDDAPAHEPEDEGSSTTETDDSGKEGEHEDTHDAEGKDPGDGEGAPDLDDEPDTKGDEPDEPEAPADADDVGDDEPAPAPAPDEPEGEPDEEEPEHDAAGDKGGDDREDEEPHDDSDEEKDDDFSGVGTEGGSPEDADDDDGDGKPGDEPTDDDDDPGSDSPAAGDEPPAGGEEGVPGSSAPEEDETPDESLSSLFDEERDFDKDMSEILSKEGKRELTETDYRIYSTEWDRIEPAPEANGKTSAEAMVDATQHMVGGMQKYLERAMAAQQRRMWSSGQRRGRIAPGSLFKSAVGDDRLFRRRYETRAKNTVVSLVIDCSGSMSCYDRIGTAGRTAFALSNTLERIKIRHEVIGFTTRVCEPLMDGMRSDPLGRHGYARYEALYLPVFKAFNERLTTEAISRIAHLTERPGWIRENVDGESVQLAAHRLKQQTAERHVMIVLSDGEPACGGDSGLSGHLRKVVKDLEASGTEVIGIGIQSSAVKHFYTKHIVLNELAELPTTVIGQLTNLLLD